MKLLIILCLAFLTGCNTYKVQKTVTIDSLGRKTVTKVYVRDTTRQDSYYSPYNYNPYMWSPFYDPFYNPFWMYPRYRSIYIVPRVVHPAPPRRK